MTDRIHKIVNDMGDALGPLAYTRPLTWPIVALFMLAGYVLAGSHEFSIKLFYGVLSWGVFGQGGCLAFNTFFDGDFRRDVHLVFMSNKPSVKGKSLLLLSLCLMAAGFVAALLVNPLFALLYVLAFGLGILYSMPPVRLKGRPGLDVFTNGLGYGSLTFLAGWLIVGGVTLDAVLLSIPFFFIFAGGCVLVEVYQIEDDLKTKTRTLASVLGARTSVISCFIVSMVGGILLLTYIPLGLINPLSGIIVFPMLLGGYLLVRWYANGLENSLAWTYRMYGVLCLFGVSLVIGQVLG